jgi:hypothetical protein
MAVLQQVRLGEGYLLAKRPLTQPRLLLGLAALSHKGRGVKTTGHNLVISANNLNGKMYPGLGTGCI